MKKTLIMGLICVIMANSAFARGYRTCTLPSAREKRCNDALNACDDLVKAQNEQIKELKRDVTELNDQLADANAYSFPDTLSLIAGFVIGILLPFAIGK